MDRHPVVAGQFYPGSPQALEAQVRAYLDLAAPGAPAGTGKPAADAAPPEPALLAMTPHAGYVFSGPVAGVTLAAAAPHPTVLLLGPNHTGRGAPMALWPDGGWLIPGGRVPVDEELAGALLATVPGFGADHAAHLGEHSLEVVLPFLRALNPATTFVPVAVAVHRLDALLAAGEAVAGVLQDRRDQGRPVSIVVSSDMNHFADDATTRDLDALALERVLALDATGLLRVVRERGITMCGVLPMTLALTAAVRLGASRAEVVAYDTSARASGDASRVVGYAGVVVR
jgi:AmmeMemoRadiSam system protein B